MVLESSFEQISKIKKRPTGADLETIMKTPMMSEGSDSVQELLVTGLMELCKAKPVGLDAVQWLGEWLIKNNPNQPNLIIPDDEDD
jgi:predicted amino acid racemase